MRQYWSAVMIALCYWFKLRAHGMPLSPSIDAKRRLFHLYVIIWKRQSVIQSSTCSWISSVQADLIVMG